MFDDGSDKLDAHLDVVKIVKSLKKLKILMENTMMTDDIKKEIKHSEKNIIYLSSEEEDTKEKTVTEMSNLKSVLPMKNSENQVGAT